MKDISKNINSWFEKKKKKKRKNPTSAKYSCALLPKAFLHLKYFNYLFKDIYASAQQPINLHIASSNMLSSFDEADFHRFPHILLCIFANCSSHTFPHNLMVLSQPQLTIHSASFPTSTLITLSVWPTKDLTWSQLSDDQSFTVPS